MKRTWQDDFRLMIKAKVLIGSMADRDRFVRNRLDMGYDVRIEHLLKLYFYPEGTQYRGVWMRSVFSATHEVLRLKRTKRHPNKHFIYEIIWLSMDPDVLPNRLSDDVGLIAEDNPLLQSPELPLDPSIVQDCMKYLYAYHEWLAEALSKKGYVTSSEVYDKLKELLSQSIYKK